MVTKKKVARKKTAVDKIAEEMRSLNFQLGNYLELMQTFVEKMTVVERSSRLSCWSGLIENGGSYYCTQLSGHSGDHVALDICGKESKRWPNEVAK